MRVEAFEENISRLLNEIQYDPNFLLLPILHVWELPETQKFFSHRFITIFWSGMRMLGRGRRWLLRFSTTLFYSNRAQSRSSFCTSTKNNNDKNVVTADERYRQLENLDMMTAAKILFTDPPKKKKFGFDFHLVQFFFACMPSLAVYLVAQYARYQMRTMEVEVEQKKKLRDEEQAKEKEKEMELNPPEVSEAKSDPQLSEVKERLEKLEEAVKEIAVVTKKQSGSSIAKNQVTDDEKKPLISSAPRDTSISSASNKPIAVDRVGNYNSHTSKPESAEESKGSVATQNCSPQDPKSQNQS